MLGGMLFSIVGSIWWGKRWLRKSLIYAFWYIKDILNYFFINDLLHN